MAAKRDDDITDLTGDDESVGKGNGKDKGKGKDKKGKDIDKDREKDRETGLPAPQPGKGGKAGKKGKGKGKAKGEKQKGLKLKIKLILIIVPVLLVAGFVAALILNFYGIRDIIGGVVKGPMLSAVVWFDPEYSSVEEELRAKGDAREAELSKRGTRLDERESKIAGREEELDARRTLLDTRESQLDRRGAALDKREEQLDLTLNNKTPTYSREMTEQELADMQSLSRVYSQMSPGAAAEILVELDNEQHVAAILYYMGERNAAVILEAMETEFAAKITEVLLFS